MFALQIISAHTHTQPLAKFKKVILSKVKEEWGNFPS
jgi:hypothetical protein